MKLRLPDVFIPTNTKEVITSIIEKIAFLAKTFLTIQVFVILRYYGYRSFSSQLVEELKHLKSLVLQEVITETVSR